MISPRDRGDLARFYTVTDPKKHQKGYTVYKVTARIVSRRNPEDVQEVVVWKRYSDFKKLHKELWQIHKSLYRHTELFPPFAKAKVFGRFDDSVIEERRQCAEDLLQFSANIPALYNSHQCEEFFKGGEVHDGSDLIGPAEPFSDSLTDSLSDCSTEVRKDFCGLDDATFASQSEGGGFSSDSDLISLTVDVDSIAELDDGMASNQASPSRAFGLSPSPEPLAKSANTPVHEWGKPEAERESRSLFTGSLKQRLGKPDYLEKAGELIKLALKKEEDQDYEAAFSFYRKGVDLLLEGVQGESSPTRREAVKKKTAEYLIRAEKISSLCQKSSGEDGSACEPPGPRSSRPSWNLRSPAEELKAFRVLGVIGKVLLVLDKRNQQTFILKGLRKSSECSRSRKTIIPRCVPNMVSLHKYIISEESVFLLLQHAEGGMLWSSVSKFLNRSPEGSFEVPDAKRLKATGVHVKQVAPSPRNSSGSSSIESRESNGGNMLKVLPLKNSLTPSSQDDSSTQEEEGRASPVKWVDSGSSSEEECTTSYLTLCNEYGQEKIEPDSLREEPLVKIEGEDNEAKGLGNLQRSCSAFGSDTLSTQLPSQELPFFTEEAAVEAISPTRISDSLSKSKNSPMEFFRIDSKDSGSELLSIDFGDKFYSLKSEPLKPLLPVPDHDSSSASLETTVDKMDFKTHDNVSRGSNDSVPVISFKDAAWDDVSSTDEGRPDLLVNLPGVSEQLEEGPPMFPKNDFEVLESKLLETPDVLQLNHSLEQCSAQEENGNSVMQESVHSFSKESSGVSADQIGLSEDVIESLFTALSLTHSESMSQSLDAPSQGLRSGTVASASSTVGADESLLFAADQLSSTKKPSSAFDSVQTEELFVLPGQAEDFDKVEATETLLLKVQDEGLKAEGESGRLLEGEKGIHQIFQDLDERLTLTSQFFIPEDCIQRWAAEIVIALDALHREGIVCRDLNPNNILLNERGHIQLTYFSRWREVEDSCDSDAMERMYCAPEIGSISEETEACDWWSLGAVLFELLSGKALVDCHPAGINTHTSLNMPEYVSEEAKSLIQQISSGITSFTGWRHKLR
ncbi:ribosomal protein S6 kinase delta-1 isoform X2 [Rhinatrema bivittatum]|uniref:ribosomal protein S6 kinase delta-1 isoform X2 n=1 Tax=Rhinatrema bivittatum TaxID=194408 RepID=UPI00112EDB01|nr:ribosomal protein S6 kinase delta-1 isoform X2 [Rhinatrema bivittatum]